MRVVQVSTGAGFRGGEQQSLYLVEGLHGLGVEQHVVAFAGGRLLERCSELGIDHTPIRSRAGAVWALRRLGARADGSWIGHGHDGHAHTVLYLASLLGSPLRYVISRRVPRAPAPTTWRYAKYNHPRLLALLCVSEAIAELHRVPGVTRVPVHTVYSAGRVEGLPARDLRGLLGVSADAKLVGTIAAIDVQKDPLVFAEVGCRVLRERPDAHVVHIGSGDAALGVRMRDAVADAGMATRFHFLGQRRDANALLADLDVFLFTSQWEGLGSALLQAQLRGAPIVSTDPDGIPEIVRPGVSGLLRPVRDIEGLAADVLRLLADPAEAGRLAAAAREQARGYSVERMVRETLALYGAYLPATANA